MAGGLLDGRAELVALFDELDQELARLGLGADVVMVGGADLSWAIAFLNSPN